MQHPSVHLLYDSCTVLVALYCLLEQKYLIHSIDPRALGHFHSGIPSLSMVDPVVPLVIFSVNPTVLLIDMFYKAVDVPKSGFGQGSCVPRLSLQEVWMQPSPNKEAGCCATW